MKKSLTDAQKREIKIIVEGILEENLVNCGANSGFFKRTVCPNGCEENEDCSECPN